MNRRLIAMISAVAVGFGVFLAGFVLNEPAPYELYMCGLIAVWAIFGLRLSRAILPLIVLLVGFNLGGLAALSQLASLQEGPMYIAVSFFLALTAIFFAAVVEARPEILRLIAFSWVVSAVITATLGIIGYFSLLPGAHVFTRFDRAAGAFEDPNVFGPFLAFPGIYLVYRILVGNLRDIALAVPPLMVIVIGLFLSFSRGAWGVFVISTILLATALFLQSNSGRFRLRLSMMSVMAVAVVALAILAALQLPGVADLFTTRAHLVQDYDSARLGRFARFPIGFAMALEHPLGIGPLVFGTIFSEDTHNIWLKALMDYGWLGFLSYLTLILWTLAAGFRILFRDRPWQPYLLCAYVVLIGHVGLGTVIDTDHWRHFYLLLGLIWGCIALEMRIANRRPRGLANQSLLAVRRDHGFMSGGGTRIVDFPSLRA